MTSADQHQSLREIEVLLLRPDLEEGLQDLRDLAEAMVAGDLAAEARRQLASWRYLGRTRSLRTWEQFDIAVRQHIDDAFTILEQLTERSRLAELAATPPPETPSWRPPFSTPVSSQSSSPLISLPSLATLVCRDVAKQYRRAFRLAGVSLDLHLGQVLGVVGPNGSGKTTLLRILAGELAHDVGDVVLDGREPGGGDYLARVAYVPQRPDPWSHSVLVHLQWRAALEGARTVELNRDRVEDVLTWLQLSTHRDKRFGELSEGQRMRVAVAAAVLSSPKLLILDEPLAPLDPVSQLALLGWIRRRTREWRGIMTVLSSQHVPEVELIADHTLYLRDGHRADRVPARPPGSAYEVTPRDDRAGFAELMTALEAMRARGELTEIVARERYAVVAVLGEVAPLHLFAEQIRAARPRMIRDVSESARCRMLMDDRE